MEIAKHHTCSQRPGLAVFIMEHSKEFYESLIRVIDYLKPNVWNIEPEKGGELAGNYWPEIGRMLKEDYNAGLFEYGNFRITRREKLPPLREDCKHIIEEFNKADYDRNLANMESEENIKYGRKGYRISIIALIISLLAFGLEIVKWLQG